MKKGGVGKVKELTLPIQMKVQLFNKRLIEEKILKEFHIENQESYARKKEIVLKWAQRIEDRTLIDFNEEQLQGEFIRDFFSEILNAKNFLSDTDTHEWNVLREEKTITDGSKADAVLGFFTKDKKDYRVAIELKGPRVNLDLKQTRQGDRRTPIEQGFSYLPKYGKKCDWLIVSNYREIRLYNHKDASEYEVFHVTDLVKESNFKKFLYLLSFTTLVSRRGTPKIDRIFEENVQKERSIEGEFYELYSETRVQLFNTILEYNESFISSKVGLEKTQKMLDRFIFICFVEDQELIPANTFQKAVKKGTESYSIYGVWESVRGLFNSIDLGNKNKEINKFNGGLFKKDEVLDNLTIPNSAFDKLVEISKYDFNSDLNVNILGHIFEQSISDLEEIKSSLSGDTYNLAKGKRKEDGIFYTPKDTTSYIVRETIGEYLERIRKDLGESKLPKLEDKDLIILNAKGEKRYTAKLLRHISFWNNYRDAVSNVKILDPSCGSGAFLNEAFDYLYEVGMEINQMLEEYTGNPSFFEIDRDILKNNIYGVDLNKESIEITKLSLWLKTANKNKELTALDDNIKCGNSLISSGAVSTSNFIWREEFKEVFDNGGFDIIIGNPPYVRNTSISKNEKEYYTEIYYSAHGQYDLYVLFNELIIKLLKENGIAGLIQPNKFLSAKYGERLLNVMNDTCKFLKVKNVSQEKIFLNASVYPYIFIFEKERAIPKEVNEGTLSLFDICETSNLINFEEEIESRKTFLKINKRSDNLEEYVNYVRRGIPNKQILFTTEYNTESYKAIKSTDLMYPYYLPEDQLNGISYISEKYKATKEMEFEHKVIMLPRTVKTIRAILNDNNTHVLDRIYYMSSKENSIYNESQLIAMLNSNVSTFYYNYKYGDTKIGGGYFDLNGSQIKELPIPKKLTKKSLREIDEMVEKSTKLYEEFSKIISTFHRRVKMNFQLENLGKKIESFYILSSSELLKEFKKRKVKLTLKEQDDWEEYFFEKKNDCLAVLENIKENEKRLNAIFYKYYKFTDSDIKIIEGIIEGLEN